MTNPLPHNRSNDGGGSAGYVVRVDESRRYRYLYRSVDGRPAVTGDTAVVEDAARVLGWSSADVRYVDDPVTWPDSVVPALLRRAAAVEPATLLPVDQRTVRALQELRDAAGAGGRAALGLLAAHGERGQVPAGAVLDYLWTGAAGDPVRDVSAMPAVVLGRELRRLREAAGLALDEVAGESADELGAVEGGGRAPTVGELRMLLRRYGVVEGSGRWHLCMLMGDVDA